MAPRTPVTDAEKAMVLNYPPRPTNKSRAIVRWKGVQCDLGPYGSAESFFTLLALRKRLADGEGTPVMREFRRNVMAEADPIGAEDAKHLSSELASMTAQRDSLRASVDALEESQRVAEDSLQSAMERRDELTSRNADLEDQVEELSKRKPRRLKIGLLVASAASVLFMGMLLADLPPKVDGQVISDHEKSLVRGSRTRSEIRAKHLKMIASTPDIQRSQKEKGATEWLTEELQDFLDSQSSLSASESQSAPPLSNISIAPNR